MTHLALLLTYTRSAWLGWIVAVAVLLILKWPKALAWAVPLAILAISLAPLPFFSRVISSFDIKQSSNLDRIRMAEAGVEIIKDYPLLGVGPANVKEVYPLYRKHDAPRFRIPHLHNNIIQLWAERGVLALVAYLFLQFLFLRECARGWGGPCVASSPRSAWRSRWRWRRRACSSSTSATPRSSGSARLFAIVIAFDGSGGRSRSSAALDDRRSTIPIPHRMNSGPSRFCRKQVRNL